MSTRLLVGRLRARHRAACPGARACERDVLTTAVGRPMSSRNVRIRARQAPARVPGARLATRTARR